MCLHCIPHSLCLSMNGDMAGEEDRRDKKRKKGEGREEVLESPVLSGVSSILVKLQTIFPKESQCSTGN